MAFPPDQGLFSIRRTRPAESDVEYHRGDEKEAEHEDLDKETDDDDLLTNVEHFQRARRLNAAATSLHKKGDHIADNKNLGHPLDGDDGARFGMQRADQPSEDHVDGCCVQCWCDEDENGLHYKTAEGRGVKMGPDPAAIADNLNCNPRQTSQLVQTPLKSVVGKKLTATANGEGGKIE